MSTATPALPTRTDVLVVGAGPTGLTVACALAARGLEPLVVDRAAQGANTSRAAVLHARTLEVLEDVGVTDELRRRGVVVPQFTIRDRDRPVLRVPFGDLPTRYPYTLMLPQDVTERVLSDRLAALGGHVHRSPARRWPASWLATTDRR
jgi:2-polyprenyl-6-methoxyphenol hydroxylase-like FAD-dependent oxidoreductase